MNINGKDIIIDGKFLRIARIEEEWFVDVNDPDSIVNFLKSTKRKADIFTFWQRLPQTNPRYDYYFEWENVAVLTVKSFEYWWKKQINAKTRNLVRKAEKEGIEVKLNSLDEEFLRGISSIFNETPIRQGRPFWHYGKELERIKNEMSHRLPDSDFIGAYYQGDLIGFIKLLYTDNYAMMVEIISKLGHRSKSPNNALIAKAVQICAGKQYPYIIYSKWLKGTLGDFKRRNGFEQVDLPRYYVPITSIGEISLRLKLHHGVKNLIPEKILDSVKDARRKWYQKGLYKILC